MYNSVFIRLLEFPIGIYFTDNCVPASSVQRFLQDLYSGTHISNLGPLQPKNRLLRNSRRFKDRASIT